MGVYFKQYSNTSEKTDNETTFGKGWLDLPYGFGVGVRLGVALAVLLAFGVLVFTTVVIVVVELVGVIVGVGVSCFAARSNHACGALSSGNANRAFQSLIAHGRFSRPSDARAR